MAEQKKDETLDVVLNQVLTSQDPYTGFTIMVRQLEKENKHLSKSLRTLMTNMNEWKKKAQGTSDLRDTFESVFRQELTTWAAATEQAGKPYSILEFTWVKTWALCIYIRDLVGESACNVPDLQAIIDSLVDFSSWPCSLCKQASKSTDAQPTLTMHTFGDVAWLLCPSCSRESKTDLAATHTCYRCSKPVSSKTMSTREVSWPTSVASNTIVACSREC